MHQGWLRSLIAGWVVHLGVRVRGMLRLFLHDEAKGGRRTRYLFQQNPGGGVEVGVEALTGSLPS